MVEFNSENDVKNVLSASCHIDTDDLGVPVKSPFLWFRVCPKKQSLKLPKTNKLNIENGCRVLTNDSLMELLKKCENVTIFFIFKIKYFVFQNLKYFIFSDFRTNGSSL